MVSNLVGAGPTQVCLDCITLKVCLARIYLQCRRSCTFLAYKQKEKNATYSQKAFEFGLYLVGFVQGFLFCLFVCFLRAMCKFISDILWTFFGCEKFLQTGSYEKFINDFIFMHTVRIMVVKKKTKKLKVAVGF